MPGLGVYKSCIHTRYQLCHSNATKVLRTPTHSSNSSPWRKQFGQAGQMLPSYPVGCLATASWDACLLFCKRLSSCGNLIELGLEIWCHLHFVGSSCCLLRKLHPSVSIAHIQSEKAITDIALAEG